MRLHEKSQNRMSFRIFPSASSWFWAFVWLAFAGFCFFIGSSSLILICTKTSDENLKCKIVAKRFFLTMNQRHVEGVHQVKVQPAAEIPGVPGQRKKSEAYRLALVTPRGEFPLTPIYSSGYEPKAQWARKLNEFIKDSSARRLVLVQPASPLILLVGLFCAGMAVLFFETTYGLLDKNGNSIRLVRWGIKGRKIIEMPLTHILRFEVARARKRRNAHYRLMIKIAESPALPVRELSRIRLRFHRKRVDQLNAFLHGPLDGGG
jgi:hypothetical protein